MQIPPPESEATTSSPPHKHEQDYKAAVTVLLRLGYELSTIYAQHAAKLTAYESAQPTELDLTHSLTTPASWVPHFEDKTATQPKGFIPVLSTSTLRAGGQFLLSPGQRARLRAYGLTPTRVVECASLDFYPGTKAVRTLVLKSCMHVPEHKRKHLLMQVTINDFGAFMQAAKELEHEVDEANAEKVTKQTTAKQALSLAIAAEYI